MMSTTLGSRLKGLRTSAPTSMFVHWLVGMVYVFYFASFVLVLREVVRPGLLWFIRNLNDPEFNPIQEMIQLPVLRHVRRLFASTILFSVSILLTIYLPIRILQWAVPTLLPYNISLTADTPLGDLSLELLLLQVVLPVLMEQSQAKVALRMTIKHWCTLVGLPLDLVPYLLPTFQNVAEDGGNDDGNNNNVGAAAAANEDNLAEGEVPPAEAEAGDAAPAPVGGAAAGNLAAEHQALLLAREPATFQQYRRPNYFAIRIVVLLILLAITCLVGSVLCLSIPVALGRWCVSLVSGQEKVHEIYTISVGLYVGWLALRLGMLAAKWVPKGWKAIAKICGKWALVTLKLTVAATALLGLLPLLIGTLFQLMTIAPLRVNMSQTPLMYHWQDWVLGLLHCKVICAVITMGPNWWMKAAFERLVNDGIRNINLKGILEDIVLPTSFCVGSVLALPYLLAHGSVLFGATDIDVVVLKRTAHPLLLVVVSSAAFLVWQFSNIKRFVSRIRNEKYLIGQQLMNYEGKKADRQKSETADAETPPPPVVVE